MRGYHFSPQEIVFIDEKIFSKFFKAKFIALPFDPWRGPRAWNGEGTVFEQVELDIYIKWEEACYMSVLPTL